MLPPDWLQDEPPESNATNTADAGSGSESVTACASEGPVSVTLIVYSRSAPAVPGLGAAELVTVTSALAAIDTLPVSDTGVGSSVDCALGVLVSVAPSARLDATVVGTVMVTLAPAAIEAIVQLTFVVGPELS
jgi:hypothetical protein